MLIRQQSWIFCLLLAFLSFGLSAQTQLDSVQQLREISVFGNRYSEVIPAQKLSGKALEALSSYSVADAIRYFSGVQIKDYGGVGGLRTVDIRSMGTNHMGVFYDGIQLGNAQNGQIDLGKFSLDNIEEISLYNGQKSDIFQSAKDFGSSGTIYLRTRRPRFEDGKKTNVTTYIRTGSFGLINPSVLWEQKLSERVNFSFNAEYVYADGRYKVRSTTKQGDGSLGYDTTYIRENGDVHSLRIEGGFNGALENGRWNAKAYFYDSERGIPGAVVGNKFKNSQRQWDRNFFAQGSMQKAITSKYELLLNAKFANDYMRYLNPDTTLMYIDNNFVQREMYASVVNLYKATSDWQISLAGDYQWNTLDANLTDFVNPQRHTALVALATAYDWNRLKIQASLLGTFVFEQIKNVGVISFSGEENKAADNTQKLTPALFVSYSPFEAHNFNIRAFYKHIFRMPTLNDLYYTNIGNVKLRPEYAKQYNLGFQYSKNFHHAIFQTLRIQTDAYFNQIIDKIIATPKGDGQYRWMMLNLDYVEIRGLDFSAQLLSRLFDKIMLETSVKYTFQKAQDMSNPADNDPYGGNYKGQIAYIPWNSGSLTARAIYEKWDLNYSFIYVGERYRVSANIPANYERPWYTHDLTLGREFEFWKLKSKLSLEVNNLANQQFDVIRNYPMPGRNYKLILKVKF